MKDDSVTHHYDEVFYRYQREGSLKSARLVLPVVHAEYPIKSVLDVGCGAGAWLRAHHELGVPETVGVDGEYVDRSVLLIAQSDFQPRDITEPFNLARQFDLVECLEVAEHVPTARSAMLIDNVVRHGRRVLFSAAVPGQGGEDHINEQACEFWRDLFAARGYRLFDFVRPRIVQRQEVESWYRYNTLFFAHDSTVDTLSAEVQATRVPEAQAIRDYSPLVYRARKFLLKHLPIDAVSKLAVWKHEQAIRAMRNRGRSS